MQVAALHVRLRCIFENIESWSMGKMMTIDKAVEFMGVNELSKSFLRL